MQRALIDFSDAELRESLRATSTHVQYSYNDIVAEIDRRAAVWQGRVAIVTSIISAVVAVVAVVLSTIALLTRH